MSSSLGQTMQPERAPASVQASSHPSASSTIASEATKSAGQGPSGPSSAPPTASSHPSSAPKPSTGSRIRPGILSRQASEREEAELTGHLYSASEDDDARASDSGSLPRRFPPTPSHPSSAASSLRNAKKSQAPSPLSPPSALGYFAPSGGEASSSSSRSHLPLQSKTSLYRSQGSGGGGNAGDWSEDGGPGLNGITFGSDSLSRAKSVSSVSSVNSTSSMEAVPFRAAPLGNVRLGYGGYGGGKKWSRGGQTQRKEDVQGEDIYDEGPHSAQPMLENSGKDSPDSFAHTPGKQRMLPKGPSDDWHYRNAPGMGSRIGGRNNFHTVAATRSSDRPSLSSAFGLEDGDEREEYDPDVSSTSLLNLARTKPSIRSKLAKRAGKLGLKPLTSVATSSPASSLAHNLTVAASDRSHSPSNVNVRDTPNGPVAPSLSSTLSLSSAARLSPEATYRAAKSYFSTSNTNSTALGSLASDGELMMRTSSVTNAPLIVSKHPPGPPGSGAAPSPGLTGPSLPTHVLPCPSPKLSPQRVTDDMDPVPVEAGEVRVDSGDVEKADLATTLEGRRPVPKRIGSRASMVGQLGSKLLSEPNQRHSLPLPIRSPSPGQVKSQSATITPAQQIQIDAQAGMARVPTEPSGSTPGPNPLIGPPVTQEEESAKADEGRKHPSLYAPRSHSTSLSTIQTAKVMTGKSGSQRFSANGSAISPTTAQRRPGLLRASTSDSVSMRRLANKEDIRPNGKGIAVDETSGVSDYWSGRPTRNGKGSPTGSSASTRSGASADRVLPSPLRVDNSPVGLATGPLLSHSNPVNRLHSPAPPSVVTSEVTISGKGEEQEEQGREGKTGNESPEKTMQPLPPIDEAHGSSEGSGKEADPDRAALPSTAVSVTSSASLAPISIIHPEPQVARPGQSFPCPAVKTDLTREPQAGITAGPSAAEARSPTSTARPRGASVGRSTRVESDFCFGEILGEGSYSTVMEAWDMKPLRDSGSASPQRLKSEGNAMAALAGKRPTGRQRECIEGAKVYAVKVLDKMHILKEKKQKYVSLEKEALSLLIRHSGVITLYWTFQDRDSLYFVLELAPNGELLTFIKKLGSFDLECTRYYGAQLVDTIEGMHVAGVLHRDLKPENILLDREMRIKVTDFGSAKMINRTEEAKEGRRPRASSFVGTAEYVSPELLTDKQVSEASDWWAFGCLLYQMLCGKPPFKGASEYQTFQKIMKREFETPEQLSSEAKDLIDSIMVLDPDQRFKAKEIRSHSFFLGLDWSTIWKTEAPELQAGIVKKPAPSAAALSSEGEVGSLHSHSTNLASASDDDGRFSARDSSASAERVDRQSTLAKAGIEVQDADDDDSSFSDSNTPVSPRQRGFSAGASAAERMLAVGSSGGKRASNFFRMAAGISPSETKTDGGSGNNVGNGRGSQGAVNRQPIVRRSGSYSFVPTLGEASKSSSVGAHPPLPPTKAGGPATNPGQPSMTTSWAALLLPHESLLYACPILHKTTGALLRTSTKKRQLLLTDFPRLLCVKETNDQLRVKSEVILGLPQMASRAHSQWSQLDDEDDEEEEEEGEEEGDGEEQEEGEEREEGGEGEEERAKGAPSRGVFDASSLMKRQSSAGPLLASSTRAATAAGGPKGGERGQDHAQHQLQQQPPPPSSSLAGKKRATERRESIPLALRTSSSTLNHRHRQGAASHSSTGPVSSLMNASPNFMTSIEQKSIRTFLVATPAKSFLYEDPTGDATHWVKSITMAAKRTEKQSTS